MSFLYASYKAGDTVLANKVSTSVRSDLNEQLRYYRLLGDQVTNDQLASDAMNYLQNKPNSITERQAPFAQDIYSSFQMLLNMDEWHKQFGPPAPRSLESTGPILNNDSPPKTKDSPK